MFFSPLRTIIMVVIMIILNIYGTIVHTLVNKENYLSVDELSVFGLMHRETTLTINMQTLGEQ